MNTTELLRAIFIRLKRVKLLVLLIGLVFAVLLFFYARSQSPVYTSKATVFPLTSPTDNALTSTTLSSLLGTGDAPKSFSSDAAINIIELAMSRTVREQVALEKLPAFNNKTVTELLVEELNKNSSFLGGDKIKMPADSTSIAVLGGELIKPMLLAKMGKNGVLELYFSNTSQSLITPISYVIVNKISQFYIDLKIQKALTDYKFTLAKIDSLQGVVGGMDNKAIAMQNSTYFTPTERLEYDIPKENLSAERTRVARQRDISVNNREEAIWRLQKATPIIQILDKPTAPFEIKKPSSILYALAGLMLGCFLSSLVFVWGLIYRYIKAEIYRSIFETPANTNAAV